MLDLITSNIDEPFAVGNTIRYLQNVRFFPYNRASANKIARYVKTLEDRYKGDEDFTD
jgi:hypothetical protein